MNLSNLDILLGIYPQYSIKNLLDDIVNVEDLLVEGPKGVKILPASSGDINVARNAKKIQQSLIQALNELKPKFDYILIDTGAGISEYTMDFVYSSDKVIVVTTPEPTAITDAYALIKMLFYHSRNPDISVVINMTQSEKEGKVIYEKISQILSHFLNKQVRFLGSILTDKNLPDAVKDQTPRDHQASARHIFRGDPQYRDPDSERGQEGIDGENQTEGFHQRHFSHHVLRVLFQQLPVLLRSASRCPLPWSDHLRRYRDRPARHCYGLAFLFQPDRMEIDHRRQTRRIRKRDFQGRKIDT